MNPEPIRWPIPERKPRLNPIGIRNRTGWIQAKEQWGDPKFSQFIGNFGSKNSQEFVDTLVKALAKHQGSAEQHDEITIATLKQI